ncbi:hypothetical protein ASPZODRAFT_1026323 [Penicilliopsis zonata CBS 506.65]|uniref:Uncharacterized protein n=1 Tax=Penicilliopsis zonata CBS 506.65 TaxID=1073090 RepID=A0A1L9SRM2_9EURO|nr:hypothetical protein ASPZODRAFT_1026323 [Penicilliopsis zonata CBS 506.65]OJJ49766.1 hypothetical protein ASPZODRAFT_1026323 [Penicilliopsis zonata CBS 506.65]
MWSGLHKPGALPLLVLVLFSLLRLVPSLSQQWDAYLLWKPGDVDMNILDPSIPRRHTATTTYNWTNANANADVQQYKSYATTKPPTLIKRVRSFRTLFVSRAGDVATEVQVHANLSIQVQQAQQEVHQHQQEEVHQHQQQEEVQQKNQFTIPRLYSWQQACQLHYLSEYFKSTVLALSRLTPRDPHPASLSKQTPFNHPEPELEPELDPPIHQPQESTQEETVTSISTDESGYAPQRRGSCLAIVVGLVVGIIWF